MKLIDTHHHFWDLDKFDYSWCGDIPALNRSFRPADYRNAIDEAMVQLTGTVHVEADIDLPFQLDETRWVSELARQSDSPIRGIVAAARPEDDDFHAQLERLKTFPLVKGIRRVLFDQADELSQTDRFAESLRLLPEFGMSFDLCMLARQLPLALRLAEKCPSVSFVLDHCGIPNVKEQLLEPWRGDLRALAALPNVTCKISGLVAYADAGNWTVDHFRPFVAHAIEVFGWDRVMWGSDWPVCTLSASLAAWVEAAKTLMADQSQENQQKLFHDNAVRVYRLDLSNPVNR